MARGNMVTGCTFTYKFGIYIIEPMFKWDSFLYYNRIYISKAGTLIGEWGENINYKPYKYKDYLATGYQSYEVARVKKDKIFLIEKQ